MPDSKLRNFLLLALLLWMLGSTAYRGALNPDSALTGIDFQAYYRAAQRLNAGEQLYWPGDADKSGYIYSPALAICLRPIAALPLRTGLQVWFALSAAALVASVGIMAAALRLTWRDAVPIGIMLVTAFRFWPTVLDFGLGQADFLLLALTSGILYAGSRDRLRWVAVLIAVAATIKLWMLAAGLYVLLRRAWREVIWCAATFFLLHTVAFAIVGWSEFSLFCETILANSEQTFLVSQSVLGFARLRFLANGFVVPLTDSLLAYRAFVVGAAILIVGALIYLYRCRSRSAEEELLRGGLVFLSMVLLLPLCHTGYFLLALPLLWMLLLRATPGRQSWVLTGAAIATYVLFTRTWPIFGDRLRADASGWLVSMDFFSSCLLWGAGLTQALWAHPARDCARDGATAEDISFSSQAATPSN